MRNSFILRSPTIADAESIASFSDELGHIVDTDVMARRIADLNDHDDNHIVVAEVDKQISGWIQVHACEFLVSGFRSEIVGLVVDSKFRRRGIGRLLVENAIKWSTEHGASLMVVRSNVVRKESHEFYPSVGFELFKTQAVYRRVLTA